MENSKKALTTMVKVRKIFEPIPEDQWVINTRDDYGGRHCALGHLDVVDVSWNLSNEVIKITKMDNSSCALVEANNGYHPKFKDPSIKQRALDCVDHYIAKLSGCKNKKP